MVKKLNQLAELAKRGTSEYGQKNSPEQLANAAAG
jgi:hypothetical protein